MSPSRYAVPPPDNFSPRRTKHAGSLPFGQGGSAHTAPVQPAGRWIVGVDMGCLGLDKGRRALRADNLALVPAPRAALSGRAVRVDDTGRGQPLMAAHIAVIS